MTCTCLMHRLTARLLLVLLLVSIFTPVALAITEPDACCTGKMHEHTCCARKMHEQAATHALQFQASPVRCNHDCCRPVTVSQWAENPQPLSTYVTPISSTLSSTLRSVHRSDDRSTSHSGRAPPQFSFSVA